MTRLSGVLHEGLLWVRRNVAHHIITDTWHTLAPRDTCQQCTAASAQWETRPMLGPWQGSIVCNAMP